VKGKIILNVKFEDSKMKVNVSSCMLGVCAVVVPTFLMLNPHIAAPAMAVLFVKTLLVNKGIEGMQNQLNGKQF